MSQLHDDIKDAFKSLANEGRRLAEENEDPHAKDPISQAFRVVHKGKEEDPVLELPGGVGMREYYEAKCYRTVLHAYRFTNGAKPFEDGATALDQTRQMALERLLPVLLSALSDGVQIGQKVTPTVKKYEFFDKLDKIFENAAFRTDSAALEFRISSDQEAMSEITDYVEQCAHFMAHASGFLESRDPEMVSKIWDLWGMVAGSMFIAMFMAGRIVGERWAERDVLTGIAMATEQNDG